MTPYLIIGGLVAAAGAFVYGMDVGEDRAIAKQKATSELVDAVYDKAQKGAASAIARLKPRNVTIRQELEREIQTNTVYSDCRVPARGVQIINRALEGGAERAGDRQLPRVDEAQSGP